MNSQNRASDLDLWLLEQTHPSRRRAWQIQLTAMGTAALIGSGTVIGSIVAGVAVFEAVQSGDRTVLATSTAEAHVKPQGLPGDRVRWESPVAWTDESGRTHRGTVEVSYGLPAGRPLPAGLASDGTLRQQPVPTVEAALRGILTATAVTVVGGLVLRWVVPVGRRRAESARLQSWDSAWADWNPRPPGREN